MCQKYSRRKRVLINENKASLCPKCLFQLGKQIFLRFVDFFRDDKTIKFGKDSFKLSTLLNEQLNLAV